tara:strand:- start:660 stop:1457 length:798 start_codon:yes stop_codon:yes gene_type:complete
MKKIITLILILSFIGYPLKAEIVTETGKHRHVGNISKNDSCRIAEQKAKKNAIIKSIGQVVSSNVVSNCSDVDGEFDCERNQVSLFELNGEITRSARVGKAKYGEELGSEGIYFCEVTMRVNVEPIKKNLDPTFQFDVKLNKKIFQTNDIIEIEINTSKKMYMSIFQWLPYGGKKYNVITKIFPNKKFNKKVKNNLIDGNIKLEYQVYFPDEIKKDKVDEYMIFIASERDINWLNEYAKIEGLKRQLSKTNILMEKHYSGYMIIK